MDRELVIKAQDGDSAAFAQLAVALTRRRALPYELRGGPHIGLWKVGDATVVRGNSVIDNKFAAITIQGDALIEGNIFDGSEEFAVSIGWGVTGVGPTLRDNVIIRAPLGIEIGFDAAPILEGNRIDVEGTAIHLIGPTEMVLKANTICGAEAIVTTRDPEMPAPSLAGNEVCELVASNQP